MDFFEVCPIFVYLLESAKTDEMFETGLLISASALFGL
jgi:hypothetical protein